MGTSLDKENGWYRGSMLTFVEAFVFMIVMFTLDTDKLHSMRARGTALHIALFMIAGLLVKTGLYFYINGLKIGFYINGLKIGKKEYITEMPEAQKSLKTLVNEFRKERASKLGNTTNAEAVNETVNKLHEERDVE